MRRRRAVLAVAAAAAALPLAAARAQPGPTLRLEVTGPAVPAVADSRPGCDATDIPDAPARAIRLATGEVQLYAAHHRNRAEAGPDLLHLRHRCAVVLQGTGNDDPAAYDDRAWIASPWTPDGKTVWAVLHNEFQGHLRPALCPSRRYMDCWYNALTAAVSRDAGRTYQRVPGRAGLVAALPYRYDQVGPGHHGYFNPSNVVSAPGSGDAGALYMFAFATRAGAQRAGNCLLRTTEIGAPEAWRAWDGSAFEVAFADPYAPQQQQQQSPPIQPERHVCAPVALEALRWPVTSLVRHESTGLFIALMQDGARDHGGVYYATSPDLLRWSRPALLLPAVGLGSWTCADPPPTAYPSLLDPDSADRNFETVGPRAVLFATRFNVRDCRTGMDRELVRWNVGVSGPSAAEGTASDRLMR